VIRKGLGIESKDRSTDVKYLFKIPNKLEYCIKWCFEHSIHYSTSCVNYSLHSIIQS
jgi:hypothetical protein